MMTGTARANGNYFKPERGTVHVVGRMVTRHQINPIRGLTASSLVGMLDDALRGIHADLQWTYAFLERREPMLRAVKERRLSALSRCTWSVEVDEKAHEDAGLETLADAQKTELEDLIAGIDNLTEATRFLSLATFRGFAHLERVFKDRRLVRLQPVEQWYWCQQYPSLDWLYNAGALATQRGDTINLDRFVIREVSDPINEAIAIEFLRKKAGQSDWDSFNETFGIPNIFGEAPENADQAWFERNQATLERIISGGRGFLPPGCKVNISEIANGSGAQFENRLKYSDSMIVVCATGGKLTMLSDSTGIGKGPSEEHADVFDEIVASEAEDIAEVMQRTIGKKRLDMAFPGQPHLAYLSLSNPAMRVSLSGAQAVSTAKSAGFTIEPEIASEAIGMPVEEGEEPEEWAQPGEGVLEQDSEETMVTNRQAIAEAFTGIASRNLQRFIRRITQAMEDPGDDSRKARLASIRDEFPEMLRTLNRETKLAEYLEDIMGTEFLNGLAGKDIANRNEAIIVNYDPSQPREESGPDGGQWTDGQASQSDQQKRATRIDAAIEEVKDGKGSKELFHGTRQKDPKVHIGQTFADNEDTASNYAEQKTFKGEVDFTGLKVAKVKDFDRDDINYGAIGDTDRDIKDLQAKGIDVIEYNDEDPYNRQHKAWRIVSEKAKDRFEKAMQLTDNEE